MVRLRLIAACLMVLSFAVGSPIGGAHADPGAPLVKVLALGDSFTAGLGAGSYYWEDGCARSPLSWAQQWADLAAARGVNVAFENGACSGAKTKDIVVGGQLDKVDPSIDLAMVTIGGNDIDFAKIAGECLVLDQSTHAPPREECANAYGAARGYLNGNVNKFRNGQPQTLRDALVDTLTDIGKKMHAGAKIVYLGYPQLARSKPDHFCMTLKCDFEWREFSKAAEDFEDLQASAAAAATLLLAERGVQVVFVPIMNESRVAAGKEPLIGQAAAADSALWDPVFGEVPPPVDQKFRGHPTTREEVFEAWTMGYFHPKAATYGAEARLVDDRAGTGPYPFGLTPSGMEVAEIPTVIGSVGEVLTMRLITNVAHVGGSSWDLDGDGVYEASSPGLEVTFTPTTGYVGTVRAKIVRSSVVQPPSELVVSGYLQVLSDFDHDWVDDHFDNCWNLANPLQLDSDADGLGDVCDSDPWGLLDALSGLWGDPHMVTLDGLNYDFQAAGEFHLLKDEASGIDVQMRTAKAGGWASVWAALATKIDGHKVEVGSDLRVLVDGGLLEDASVTLLGGSTVTRSADAVDIRDPHGAWVHATTMGVGVRVPPSASPVGLLGDGDGSRSNDLRTSSGEPVDPHDVRRVHERFADSWRITSSESLFTYASGQSTADFTDPTYPSVVRTLADFPAADLEAAVAACQSHGIPDGTRLDDCAFDVLIGGDIDAAVQAAVNEGVSVDPTAARFGADGVLTQSFNGSVASTFTHPNYVSLGSSDDAAGPITSASPYEGAIAGVPRHDAATTSFDVVVKGEALAPESEVSVGLDGRPAVVVAVGDDPHVVSGPPGAEVTLNGSGVTPGGVPYRKYRVVFAADHFGAAMRLRVVPTATATGQVLAVDNVRIALVTQPAQSFMANLPFTTDQVDPAAGSGKLETPGAQDDYVIPISGAPGDESIFFETTGQPLAFELHAPDGSVVSPADGSSAHRLYEGLAAGTYTLSVTGMGSAVSYSLLVTHRPPPQVFAVSVGDRIENGKIAGLVVAGAGNLETTGSEDVYTFSLGEASTVVFDGSNNGRLYGSSLVEVATGKVWGRVTGHAEYGLPAGDYRLTVVPSPYVGDYTIDWFVKPPPQVFAVSVGDRIENGKIAGLVVAGAGNLETTGSEDVYTFSLGEASTVVFDGSNNGRLYGSSLVEVATGKVWGRVTGHAEYGLPAGDYRLTVVPSPYVGDYTIDWSILVPPPAAGTPAAAILATWTADGGATGPLGTPIGTQQCQGDVCWQSYQHGEIMGVSSGAWKTSDAIRVRWLAEGGPSGALGKPTGGLETYSSGQGQGFEQGSIFWSQATGAHAVRLPIRTGYGQLGWFSGFGYPTSDQECDAGACWQSFTGGQLVSVGAAVWKTSDAIRVRWLAEGGPSGALGKPTGGLETYSSGQGQGFEQGSIFWSQATGAHAVRLPIRTGYGQLGWFSGFGYPTSDQECDAGACWQSFTGGQLVSVGAAVWKTSDAIRVRWLAEGGPSGALGKPTGGLETYSSGQGQGFEQGSIFWSQATGAHAVRLPIRTGYGQLGWFSGFGYPTSDQECDAGACWQSFTGGQLVSVGAAVWKTSDAIRVRWLAEGGPSGALGKPLSGVALYASGKGQSFEHGSVFWSQNTGAHSVVAPIAAAYASGGSYSGALGYPTSERQCADGACWQSFAGGQLVSVGTGVWSTSEQIRERWLAQGGLAGDLGKPTTGLVCGLKDGACYQGFEHGNAYLTADSHAHLVLGKILETWNAHGAQGGALGYATGDRACDADTGVCWQAFEHGHIAAVGDGAWLMSPSVRGAWIALDGAGGVLGKPTADAASLTTGDGFVQHFQHGDIYGTSAMGAHAVWGPILASWDGAGRESGSLGYPTGDRTCEAASEVCWQEFEGGQIMTLGDVGWATSGPVRERWLAGGGPTGELGGPTGNLVTATDGTSQAFENGTIYWSAATQAHAVVPPILEAYLAADASAGSYGYPASEAVCAEGACVQTFTGGTITAAQ